MGKFRVAQPKTSGGSSWFATYKQLAKDLKKRWGVKMPLLKISTCCLEITFIRHKSITEEGLVLLAFSK